MNEENVTVQEVAYAGIYLIDQYLERIAELESQKELLLNSIEELYCNVCNTVFPSISMRGSFNLVCKCGIGIIRTSSINQRRAEKQVNEAQDRIAELEAENASLRAQRQPLTAYQVRDIIVKLNQECDEHEGWNYGDFATAIERVHGIGGRND